MSIVKYTLKNGSQVAYESTARWDPKTKQNRPIRKYLRRIDPSTGEIIPSSGKPGRPRGSKKVRPQGNVNAGSKQEGFEALSGQNHTKSATSADTENAALKEQIASMQKEIVSLRQRIMFLESKLTIIRDQAASAIL